MIKYKILDNTADILLRVYGGDSATILYNSIYALASLLHRTSGLEINSIHEESISGEIVPALIVDMMNFVISELETTGTLYFSCTIENNTTVKFLGHKFRRNIKPLYLIKAATYHNLPRTISQDYIDITLDI